jgi:hypothetical protein
MFTRVNPRCAHHVRPPRSGGLGDLDFDNLSPPRATASQSFTAAGPRRTPEFRAWRLAWVQIGGAMIVSGTVWASDVMWAAA